MDYPLFPNKSWSDRAACVGLDLNLFFPSKGVSGRNAKKICATCPVATECLDHALTVPEMHGVWGNTTPMERMDILRDRNAVHSETSAPKD
jgi:WhiB family redox-sensing transcriptional regulator